MSNELIINATDQEKRVALIEKGNVVELYVERIQEAGIVGNIYKGNVVRVLPGMQAAFVDIGLEKAAFLYVGDVYLSDKTDTQLEEVDAETAGENLPDSGNMELPEAPTVDEASQLSDEDIEKITKKNEPKDTSPPPQRWKRSAQMQRGRRGRRIRPSRQPDIGELLKEGQKILVQVTKNPIGTKGARLTMHISIPGRNLVLMPSFKHVGISRRISTEKERRRLRDLVHNFMPKGVGVIVRTACENKRASTIKKDLDYLNKIWRGIEKDLENAPTPFVLHEELDIVLRTLRDTFVDDIDRIIIDSKKEHKQILRFLENFNPTLKRAVKFYKGREPIFDTYGIESEINRALGRRVWLKSGGYIIVDQAEALTVIDINTGRYVGKRSFDDTILKINLEAAKEIANQLRLRNCGGIIIIDFIDMENMKHRERVYRAFEDALKKDRARNSILKISELGLIEMTRKRTRESLIQTLCDPCFYCDGRSTIKSKRTICYEILRELTKTQGDIRSTEVELIVHPDVETMILEHEMDNIHKTEKMINKKISISSSLDFHIEYFELRNITPDAKDTGSSDPQQEPNQKVAAEK